MTATPLSPTASSERIQSLDLLRGIALLGILIINIQSYGLPRAALFNPTSYGDFTGLNWWSWTLSYTLAFLKFISIFSLLFGAGIMLVTQKAEAKLGSSSSLFYRKMIWLSIIGLVHAYLIWYGDILVAYALLGMLLFPLRKLPPQKQLAIGVFMISMITFGTWFFTSTQPYWSSEELELAQSSWKPDMNKLNTEISLLTGPLHEQIRFNATQAMMMETNGFLFYTLWRSGGLMLVGMALYQWGVLSAKKSKLFYHKGLRIGLLSGFSLIVAGIFSNEWAEYSFEFSQFWGQEFNYWGSLGVAFGYVCVTMLWSKSQKWSWLQSRLRAVGQMALTNYIAQSLICTWIFYGHGLGLMGQLDRSKLLLIVLAIWALQLLWSRLWLVYFYYGPLEWLWRSLAYKKIQQFRKSKTKPERILK